MIDVAIDLEAGLVTDVTGQEAGTVIDAEVEMTVTTDMTGIEGRTGTVIAAVDEVVAEVTQVIVIVLALMIGKEVKEEDEDAWLGDRMGSDGLGDKMGKYKAGWLAELGDNIG